MQVARSGPNTHTNTLYLSMYIHMYYIEVQHLTQI